MHGDGTVVIFLLFNQEHFFLNCFLKKNNPISAQLKVDNHKKNGPIN
jgi:hypothetical protein